MLVRDSAARLRLLCLAPLFLLPLAEAREQASGSRSSSAHHASVPGKVKHLDCSPNVNIWQRAQQANTARYCRLLDQARANLVSRPALSLKLSEQVASSYPRSREAQLLLGAALFKLGEAQRAHQIFTELEDTERDHLAEDAPIYLWISAQAAVKTNELAVARLRYRRLLLVLSEFQFEEERARVLIEAAIVALYTGDDNAATRAYLERASNEEAPLLALLQVGLGRGLGAYLKQGLPLVHVPDLYLKVAWVLGIDADGETRPQTLVTLPDGGRHMILAFLARSMKLEQVTLHLRAIACENLPFPAHLRQELSKELTRVSCTNADETLEPWLETPPD